MPGHATDADSSPGEPDRLVRDYLYLLKTIPGGKPVIDVACGGGHNGIYIASEGFPVILADRSGEALQMAAEAAQRLGVPVAIWQIDLEQEGINPFDEGAFGAVLVFRYLHRPLIPCIRKALEPGGILIYETFTADQAAFGRPRNPEHLLKPGELREWFGDWEIYHVHEGIMGRPLKAVSQIICRKPA